jgi:type IV pilus assembly protein PilA
MLNLKVERMRIARSENGFTLIELLIVILIMGILAAIAIPIYLNVQNSAINASVQSDVRNTASNVADALSNNPTATGFVVLQNGDTAAGAILIHTDVVSVPAGEVAVKVTSSGSNLITVTGDYSAYTVCGYNADKFTWAFDSTSGHYGTDAACTPSQASGGSGGGTAPGAGTITATGESADISFGTDDTQPELGISGAIMVTCSSGWTIGDTQAQYSADGGSTWTDFENVSSHVQSGASFVTGGFPSSFNPTDGTVYSFQYIPECKNGSATKTTTVDVGTATYEATRLPTDATFAGSQSGDNITIDATVMPTCNGDSSAFAGTQEWDLSFTFSNSDTDGGEAIPDLFDNSGSATVSESQTFADIGAGDPSDSTSTWGVDAVNDCYYYQDSSSTTGHIFSVSYYVTQPEIDVLG